jgi:hypothetical protein
LGQKILSICTRGEDFVCLESDRTAAGLMPHYPPARVNRETLPELCRRADEIYLGAPLATTLYAWEPLPKVGKRHLSGLIERTAQTKLGSGGPLVVKFSPEPPMEEEDNHLTPFLAVPENELKPFWQILIPFFKKIRFIGPLALALAALVVECEHPQETFLLAWVGGDNFEIVIASPEGLVKIARSIPLRIEPEQELSELDLQSISSELTREIAMTQTFFKQQFRKLPPLKLYLITENRFAPAFENSPITIPGLEVNGLQSSPCAGRSPAEIADCAPLLGLLFAREDFSLLPPDYLHYQKTRQRYNLLIIALLLAAAGVGAWFYNMHRENLRLRQRYEEELSEYNRRRQEVSALQREIKNLEPLKDWHQYYQEVYQLRPRWNLLLSELAQQVNPDIIIDEWRVNPGQRSQTNHWVGLINGRVRAANWQQGLEFLRHFGTRLEASAWFKVEDLNYQPRELTTPGDKIFTFRMRIMIRNEDQLK